MREKTLEDGNLKSTENLDPNKILMAEFGYARETAAQAMEDRHKMVNYYLIIVGVLLNIVATLMSTRKEDFILTSAQLEYAASAFLFTLFIIGVLYLYKLIRLRVAWYESAVAMNKLKDYYHDNLPHLKLKPAAFYWTTETLKSMKINKNGTLFFYSAFLIVLIDTLALTGGFLVLQLSIYVAASFFVLGIGLQLAVYKSKLKGLS